MPPHALRWHVCADTLAVPAPCWKSGFLATGPVTSMVIVKARAITFVAPRQVRVEDLTVSEPGPGDIVVRTRYSGISSGTELLAYRGQVEAGLALDETLGTLGGTFDYPFRYGYSCVGQVEHSSGDPPAGALVFVYHPHQDRLVVPAEEAIPLGSVDPRAATLLPLVETALQISLDAGQVQQEAVAVLGLGVVGVLTGALLRQAGATVVGADPLRARRESAAAFGLTALAPEELEAWVEQTTGGRGVAVVVEASGNPQALGDGLSLLAHEGVAVVASWYGAKPVQLPLGSTFHRRRLTIRSTQVSTIPAALSGRWTVARRRATAASLLSELPVGTLATHEFPFDEAAAAYAALDEGRSGIVHAALSYG